MDFIWILVYGLEEDARQLFGQPLELHRPDRLGVFRDRNVAKVHLDVHQWNYVCVREAYPGIWSNRVVFASASKLH